MGAFGLAQIAVAAGQGEAVSGAAGIDGDDLHRKVQIFHQPLNHGKLLVVFLAEAGKIRLHDVEQLGHNGGHAAKMPRAEAAAQFVLQVRRLDVVTLRHARIQLALVGREQYRHALAFQLGRVFLQGARVAVEILALAELQAVDENAHSHAVRPLFRLAHQSQMAFVQIAHRRHKGHCAGGFAPRAHFTDGADDVHIVFSSCKIRFQTAAKPNANRSDKP